MNRIASNIDPSRLRQGAAGYREFMEKVRACSLTQAMQLMCFDLLSMDSEATFDAWPGPNIELNWWPSDFLTCSAYRWMQCSPLSTHARLRGAPLRAVALPLDVQ